MSIRYKYRGYKCTSILTFSKESVKPNQRKMKKLNKSVGDAFALFQTKQVKLEQ
jgi:hypothetical protein